MFNINREILHKTILSVAITTTTILGSLSTIAEAASLNSNQNVTSFDFQKDGPMARVGLDLAGLYAQYEGSLKGADAITFQPTNSLLQLHGNHVAVNAVASGNTDNLLIDLKGLGLQRASAFGSIVSGLLPIKAMDKMANLDSLQFALPAYRPRTNVGRTTSQADVAMRADDARALFGVDGTGVTVGVLSDSFDNLGAAATDVASGDLPPGITVLNDQFAEGVDEGRAMMQLIHDVAPGADLAFHTALLSQADFAKGILRLANKAKADVIVDDVYYFDEPMFQDGIIAKAVNKVVAKGIPYFSSAGNNDRDAYESAFNPSGIRDPRSGGEFHDFDPGAGVDVFQSITVPKDSGFDISFQWDSPLFSVSPGSGGSPNDLDIFLYDRTLTKVLASSTNNNIRADPIEVFSFVNDGSFGTDQFNLVISNLAGSDPKLMKYVILGLGFDEPTINEFDTASSTLFGHANANGSEAVGAAFYLFTPEFGTDPPVIDPFSSPGFTPILFDAQGNRLAIPEIRQKPEIVAPDVANTTFYKLGVDVEGDGFPNFIGTSAATSHAAAVAALMLEAAPGTSPSTIYLILENTALDMDDPSTLGFDTGFDFASGFGLIQADKAVVAVKSVPEPSAALGVLAFGVLGAASLLKQHLYKL